MPLWIQKKCADIQISGEEQPEQIGNIPASRSGTNFSENHNHCNHQQNQQTDDTNGSTEFLKPEKDDAPREVDGKLYSIEN